MSWDTGIISVGGKYKQHGIYDDSKKELSIFLYQKQNTWEGMVSKLKNATTYKVDNRAEASRIWKDHCHGEMIAKYHGFPTFKTKRHEYHSKYMKLLYAAGSFNKLPDWLKPRVKRAMNYFTHPTNLIA